MKIYDCFLFFDEDIQLDIRLNEIRRISMYDFVITWTPSVKYDEESDYESDDDVSHFNVNMEIVGRKEFICKLIDWKNIEDLIPSNFKNEKSFIKSGKAGIFAGSLELVKEGDIKIKQNNLFDDIYIKENK